MPLAKSYCKAMHNAVRVIKNNAKRKRLSVHKMETDNLNRLHILQSRIPLEV